MFYVGTWALAMPQRVNYLVLFGTHVTMIHIADIRKFMNIYCASCKDIGEHRVKCLKCKIQYVNQCSVCKRKYNTRANLRMHIYRKHCFNSFVCSACPKRYPCIAELTAHEWICKNKSAYTCPKCSNFKSKYCRSLEIHMRNCHAKDGSKVKIENESD